MLAAVRVGAPPHVQQAEAGCALKHRAVARLERLAPMSDQSREGHIHREAGQRDRPAFARAGAARGCHRRARHAATAVDADKHAHRVALLRRWRAGRQRRRVHKEVAATAHAAHKAERLALEPAHDGRLLARRRGRRRGRLVGRLGSPAACRNHHTHPSFVGRERGVRPDGMRPDAVSEPAGAVRREHTHPRDRLAVSEPAAARVVEEEHGAKRQPAAPAQALKVRPFVARVDLLVRDEVREAATGIARHFKRVE
mmetsp:Transcript_9379/g.31086  ORF Transcript_9379/g.31086 Transcript_9379/m.31086 type:complete len:255 (+) Transcript_9379:515-1279(+)